MLPFHCFSGFPVLLRCCGMRHAATIVSSIGKGYDSACHSAAQVSPHAGDEEIRLEVLVEYSATADSGDGGPARGRQLSLPVQLFVQPAVRVRFDPALHAVIRTCLIDCSLPPVNL